MLHTNKFIAVILVGSCLMLGCKDTDVPKNEAPATVATAPLAENDQDMEKEISITATRDIGAIPTLHMSTEGDDTALEPTTNTMKKGDTAYYEMAVKIDVSKNWMTITNPYGVTQTHKFPNQRGPKYLIDFFIQTNLKYNEVKIVKCVYESITGGVSGQEALPNLCTDYYHLGYRIRTNEKKMTGKFIIFYTLK